MFIGIGRAEKPGKLLAALAIAGLLSAVHAPAYAADPASAGPVQVRLFGSDENFNADITPFPKWTGALARYAGERHLEDAPCTSGRCPLQEWKSFVMGLRGRNRLRQLEAVNAYVNRTPYEPDSQRFGLVDYWATPREFLGKTGDCEDYAIAKYLSLRMLGWQPGELRLMVLKDEVRNELHAVLIAYHNGTAFVLDNLSPSVREHAAIRNYRPIFSISETAWHFHHDWNPASAVIAARAQPDRALPATRPAGYTTSAADPMRRVRHAPAPPQVRTAARSHGGPQENMTAMSSNGGAR